MQLTSKQAAFIKTVAQKTFYKTLSEFLNQRVIINSVNTVESDIRYALGSNFLAEYKLVSEPKWIEAVLAKYDFLDLTFSAPSELLVESECESGIFLLEKLGFLPEFDLTQLDAVDVVDFDVLKELTEEFSNHQDFSDFCLVGDAGNLMFIVRNILENETVVRLFISSERDLSVRIREELPLDYFPRNFQVDNAAITNARWLWSEEYFYI